MEARIAAAIVAPVAPAVGGLDAPLAAKLSALADSGGGCGGMQAGVVELQQGVGELHLEVKRAAEGGAEKAAQSGRAVEAAVGRLESTMASLKSRMATLESNQHEDAVSRKALQARATPLPRQTPLPRHTPLPYYSYAPLPRSETPSYHAGAAQLAPTADRGDQAGAGGQQLRWMADAHARVRPDACPRCLPLLPNGRQR